MEYQVIGIRADYSHNTTRGASVYNVFFCEQDGRIYGPFSVRGYVLDHWHISRGQSVSDGRPSWTVITRTTPSGREVIDEIKPCDEN